MKQSILVTSTLTVMLVLTAACTSGELENRSLTSAQSVAAIATAAPVTPTDPIAGIAPALPDGYTMDNLKSAFAVYVNERLWSYPEKALGDNTNPFEAAIGQRVKVEVRLYPAENGRKNVYAQTELVNGLVQFKQPDTAVYVEGTVDPTTSSS